MDTHIGQLDVKGYKNLPLSLRDQFDAWVRDEGLVLSDIFHMKLMADGTVNVYVYLNDANGHRYMDHSIEAPAQAVLHHKYRTFPPKGVLV